jgi:hypothetical protein
MYLDGSVYYRLSLIHHFLGSCASRPLASTPRTESLEQSLSTLAMIVVSALPLLFACVSVLLVDVGATTKDTPEGYRSRNARSAYALSPDRGFKENPVLQRREEDGEKFTGCANVPVQLSYNSHIGVAAASQCYCTVNGELTAESSARLDNFVHTDSAAIAVSLEFCASILGDDVPRDACLDFAAGEFAYDVSNIQVSGNRDTCGGRVLS